MEGYEGLFRAWVEQITLLSSIIGGFSLAIAVELLAGEKKHRLMSAVIATFVLAASLLLISTSAGSQLVIKMAIVEPLSVENVPEVLRSAMPQIARIVSVVYYMGLGLFILGLGLAGWLQSKVVGMVTSAAAAIVGVTIAILLYAIR